MSITLITLIRWKPCSNRRDLGDLEPRRHDRAIHAIRLANRFSFRVRTRDWYTASRGTRSESCRTRFRAIVRATNANASGGACRVHSRAFSSLRPTSRVLTDCTRSSSGRSECESVCQPMKLTLIAFIAHCSCCTASRGRFSTDVGAPTVIRSQCPVQQSFLTTRAIYYRCR